MSHNSVFVEVEFYLFIVFSVILPAVLYGYMMWKKTISRKTVLLFGVVLIMVSGMGVFLLQRLKEIALTSPLFLTIIFLPRRFPGRFISCLLFTQALV